MQVAKAFVILGVHRSNLGTDEPYFDAFDIAIVDPDDRLRALGMRNYAYVRSDDGNKIWDDGYSPIPVSFDLSARRHWDFGELMWVGPSDHQCLFWSNAEAVSVQGIRTMLSGDGGERLFRGPDGNGLPLLSDLGRHLPDSAPIPV